MVPNRGHFCLTDRVGSPLSSVIVLLSNFRSIDIIRGEAASQSFLTSAHQGRVGIGDCRRGHRAEERHPAAGGPDPPFDVHLRVVIAEVGKDDAAFAFQASFGVKGDFVVGVDESEVVARSNSSLLTPV